MFSIRTALTSAALCGILAATSAAPLWAQGAQAGDMKIASPWTRATPTGASTAAGYLKITNGGRTADTLIAATADGADKVEVHEMSMQNNIMKMRQLKNGLEIEPGETVEMKPGGFHLMMIGLRTQYKEGAVVKGTLSFAKAGTVAVEFKVEPLGGGSSGGHGKGH